MLDENDCCLLDKGERLHKSIKILFFVTYSCLSPHYIVSLVQL